MEVALCHIVQEEEATGEEVMEDIEATVVMGEVEAAETEYACPEDRLQIPTDTGIEDLAEDMDTYMQIENRKG